MINKNLLEKNCTLTFSLEIFRNLRKIRYTLEYQILASLARLTLNFTAVVEWDGITHSKQSSFCVICLMCQCHIRKSETNASCYKSWERQTWDTKAPSYFFLVDVKKKKENRAFNCKLKPPENTACSLNSGCSGSDELLAFRSSAFQQCWDQCLNMYHWLFVLCLFDWSFS